MPPQQPTPEPNFVPPLGPDSPSNPTPPQRPTPPEYDTPLDNTPVYPERMPSPQFQRGVPMPYVPMPGELGNEQVLVAGYTLRG